MKRFVSLLVLLSFITASCGEDVPLSTFGSISGVVMDARTVAPLAGARVSLTPTGMSQVTSQDGTFLFDNLEVQEYTLVFAKDGYKSEQQKVSVKPGVTSPAHASLTPLAGSFVVDPSELDFGTSTTSMKIQVRNVSGVATNFSASTSNSWLTVSPNTGSITQSDYLTVIVSRESLSPGDYTGEVTIRYAGETLIIPVKMSILANLAATVTLESVSDVGATMAKVKASLTSIGSSSVSKMGICWSSTNTEPTVSDSASNQGDSNAPCSFSAELTNLTPETTYYCRAYAQNAAGVAYSDLCLSFTTLSSSSGQEGGDGDEGDEEQGTLNQGLASYYTFDSENAYDSTENELHGNPIGDVSFVQDSPTGNGLSLYLSTFKKGYINIPYNMFAGRVEYTFSFWIKDFTGGMIMGAVSSEYVRSDFPRLIITTGGLGRFYTCYDNYNTTEAFEYDFTTLMSSGWHHIVLTSASADEWDKRKITKSLFIDGVLVSSLSGYADRYYSVHGYDEDIIKKVHIGGDRDGVYDIAPSMKLDNVRFYIRPLTASEVKVLFVNKL